MSTQAHTPLAENYKRIWLQPLCCVDERCWCEDPQTCEDCGLPSIKYVRADLVEDMLAALKPLAAAANSFAWVNDKSVNPDEVFLWTESRASGVTASISVGDVLRAVAAIAKAEGQP